MLYAAYDTQQMMLEPLRLMARQGAQWIQHLMPQGPVQNTLDELLAGGVPLRRLAAASEAFSRWRVTHARPSFQIDQVASNGLTCGITEEAVMVTPFATLLHFKKDRALSQPPVLLVAPMSGHFSTLLRDTVRTLLQDHDVYITDWHNARDVSLREGAFSLDDYTSHIIRFAQAIGPGVHMMAVCQPCVAALAATAIMAENDDPAQPLSLTLMAGPVDCRVNPTSVNKLANSKPIEWFEKNLISRVPLPHAGYMRRVYPGFVQLSAFLNMNLERHKTSFQDMYKHLVDGDMDKARVIRTFYDEYFAVNDLPAEFYLETVAKVFQTYDLPLGKLSYKDRLVNPGAIRHTALLTVEGEHDDICAVGQTVAAQDLCVNIPSHLKTHHVQDGVGHYGVFSGRKWNQQIYPRVRDMVHASLK